MKNGSEEEPYPEPFKTPNPDPVSFSADITLKPFITESKSPATEHPAESRVAQRRERKNRKGNKAENRALSSLSAALLHQVQIS